MPINFAPGVPQVARTTDGGVTWNLVDESVTVPDFPRDVACWSDLRGDERDSVPGAQRTVFTVGSRGSDVSLDRGRSWERFDRRSFRVVDCVEGSLACWAASHAGRIAKLVVS